MFGIFGRLFGFGGPRSPNGPTNFSQDIIIQASAEDLFPLVDWSDDRHLWKQLGHDIQADGNRFVMTVAELRGTHFDIAVADSRPPTFIAYDTVTVPMIGQLKKSHEEYRFEQIEEGLCRATLSVDAWFVAGLRPGAWRFEQNKMDISVRNALRKLKLMAEEGLPAVQEASRRLVV